MDSKAPSIAPGVVPLMGEQLQIVADADPEKFPTGLELVVMVPGGLQPLGGIMLPAGCLLAIVPLGMSKQLRAAVRKAVAQQQRAGQVKPPGLAT